MAGLQPISCGFPFGATIRNMDGTASNLTDRDMMLLCTSVPPQTMQQFAVIYLDVTHDQIKTFMQEERENVQIVSFKCLDSWRKSFEGQDARGRLYGFLLDACNRTMRGNIGHEHIAFLEPDHQTQIGM